MPLLVFHIEDIIHW